MLGSIKSVEHIVLGVFRCVEAQGLGAGGNHSGHSVSIAWTQDLYSFHPMHWNTTMYEGRTAHHQASFIYLMDTLLESIPNFIIWV